MEQKKKRHIGRTIFIVILVLILLIPVLAYAYLALMGFSPEAMRAADTHGDHIQGEPYPIMRQYAEDGSITIYLTENELYRIADEYEADALIRENLPDFLSIKAWSFQLRDGGLDLYADAQAFGFLPLPLHAGADAAFERGLVAATLKEVHLGKWLSIPMDKLRSLGLPESFDIELDQGGAHDKVQSLVFRADGVELTDRVLKSILPGIFQEAKPLAEAFGVYGIPLPDDSALMHMAADLTGSTADHGALFAALADASDPNGTLLALTAMYSSNLSMAMGRFSLLEPFEREYIMPMTEKEIEAEHVRITAQLADAQLRYETLLTAVREQYKAGGLTLDTESILDNATGQKLLLAPLAPGLALDDGACRVLLMHSMEPGHPVKTADMPLLADVPKTSDKATGGAYAQIPYDLGILLRFPSGVHAVVHYESNGMLVINCIPPELYEQLLTDPRQPYVVSDHLPKPSMRFTMDAPSAQVNGFTLLIPDEVTAALAG